MPVWIRLLVCTLLLGLSACDNHSWNDPYPRNEARGNIRYASFTAAPKTLDPARSYSNDETIIIAQIYEPVLQYHFLKRPFTLVPLTAAEMPKVTFLDKNKQPLPPDAKAEQIAFSVYDIAIKPGIFYQPHPAFAKDKNGQYLYHQLKFSSFNRLQDFPSTASRELVAEDYVYEIKRLAQPGVNSPIYGLMAEKILGMSEFSKQLNEKLTHHKGWLDLRNYPMLGVEVIDRYHYRITLKGVYPQFVYWLAMPFFSPIPWEADAFYSQPAMIKNNITFDWYPIGTGPYVLIDNNPNRKMWLKRNPLFHPEFYPLEGAPGDLEAGYLKQAGKKLPFIDEIMFTLEKESIPRWNKFLQGYYDQSTVSSDSFDQAIQVDSQGKPNLTPDMKQKGIYLKTTVTSAITYIGFNMLDDVVGGDSERARKLRLAISIAFDTEEYISIFLNGRGVPAQGPIPPTIFGYVAGRAGINPYVYQWKDNAPKRLPLSVAKNLMKEAGYPNGINPKTGEPLILNYDLASTSGPDEKAVIDWMRKQFAKIGIQLNIRNTDYNRFQEVMRLGKGQIYIWGWIADYPDPENFLFLLHGPNAKASSGGENASNYHNPEFDKLFDQMKNMPNNQMRQDIINKMIDIARHDSPWIWGLYQEEFVLNQAWNYPSKPNVMTYNIIKYQKIDPLLRDKLRDNWNKKVLWPLGVGFLLLIALSLPVLIRYWQKERQSVKGNRDV